MQNSRSEIATTALQNAVSGQSMANYPAIFEGFAAMGIPESEIQPRVNVFTYHAWRAMGRQVRRGQHGVKVGTWVDMSKTEDDGSKTSFRRPKGTTVFHISQTDPIEG